MTATLHSAQISKETITSITGQYFDSDKPFAFPRYGNSCLHYNNGRDYLQSVATAIRKAKNSILITD